MTEKEIWDEAYRRLFAIYGENVDLSIVSRLQSERAALARYGAGKYFYGLAELRKQAKASGQLFAVKTTAASCLASYLLGATDENPLSPHYLCPKCKLRLRMGRGFVLDLDERTCVCGERMVADGFDIPYETFLPYAVDCKDATLLFEKEIAAYRHNTLSGVDALCRRLAALTGVPTDSVPLADRAVRHRLLSGEFDRVAGVFPSQRLKKMIARARPQSYGELLTVLGLANSMGAWRKNAERLLRTGACTLAEIPATRDDLFLKVRTATQMCRFADTGFALAVTEQAYTGYYLVYGMDAYTARQLAMLGLPDWLGGYLCGVHHMTCKARTVQQLKYTVLLCWYRLYFPKEYAHAAGEPLT